MAVTSISSRLLHVNENDEIGIKSETMGFRGKVRNGKGGEGAGGVCVCVVQTGCAHVRRASLRFPREVTGERKRRESEGRGCGEGFYVNRDGERERTRGR